ncbi:hypothetical protein ACF8FG_02105 [Pseudomonas sp. YQ_6]|uniref:Imidazoleglycerol-phosphate synthase n=1 Tax=Pseudomonas putida S12 TaxID=1215087 RepID=A0AA34WSD8_PSEPU|nr:hypothetical protein [Pseudomonas putida]AJA14964.1 hypothetical protein RPPX_16890 [Pseudomonas putida S12]USX36739.1 hypothetical protein NH673_26860 [Pseudomonas putida]
MSNPISYVLQRMDKRPITEGWGAVAAFSRARLNEVLLEQYKQRFSALSFVPLFNADVDHEDHIRTQSVLRGIEFGPPLLSFANASLENSTAQLTFPILAGVYRRQSPLAENLQTRFIIDASMGYSLMMNVDLKLVTGEIDRRGRVTLDLAEASSFSCNLGGEDEHLNGLITAAMLDWFKRLPAHQGQFELGMIDFSGYSALSPVNFTILTQPAPGAKVLGADNYGDGAVLTFIQLRANTQPGQIPKSFPYLIPDDLDEDGSELYSATIVVDKALLGHVSDDNLDVLASILFGTLHKFEERERHTPHDLAVFGSIVAVPPLYTIDSPTTTVPAGGSVKFTLRDQAGEEVQASQWYARSRQSHLAVGDGEIGPDGLYQAVGLEDIGHHSLTIFITAELDSDDGKETHRVTTQLIVQFEQVQIAPRVGVFAARTPIALSAAMPGGNIEWSLLGDPRGQLAQTHGHRNSYTAEKAASRRQLTVQQVQATGSQQRMSTLVMLNGLQSMVIDPVRATGLKPGEVVPLIERDPELLPDARRRWKLIGPGTLDGEGNYIAPSGEEQGASVVTCELVENGVVLASGYSLLEFGEAQLVEEGTWIRLKSYTITVPGGTEQGAKGELLRNGFQSLRLQVVIETEPVDGQYYKLTADERATIGLTIKQDKQEVASLPDHNNPSGGLDAADKRVWGIRRVANRFDLVYSQLAEALPARNEEAITRQDLYLHTKARAGQATTFYSMFLADAGGPYQSDDNSGNVGATIEITPKSPPVFGEQNYSWTRVRVEGSTGLPNEPGDPAFDYNLVTQDYWILKLINSSFETIEFLARNASDPHISTSMIRWESENKNEVMFSFTGSIFRDSEAKDAAKWNSGEANSVPIDFDENLSKLMANREELKKTVFDDVFEQGTLVITNHRVMDFDYVGGENATRDQLSRSLVVLLRDRQGNAHYRRFAYRGPTTLGHRNYIDHTLFTPV